MAAPTRLDLLKQFEVDDPNDAFTRFAIAQEYAKMGDYSSARTYYERLVEDHPDYVGTYYHLGALYIVLGLPEDAMRIYKQGIVEAEKVTDMHARSELLQALQSMNDSDLYDD